ncbi:phage tail protein [Halodesulfovibrio aestuarii]|uniref:Phage tail protein n=1 Tax=Halodesulfovibrio aestuarii TaxID=126333 RepID=A0ABV4JTL0_9BACT
MPEPMMKLGEYTFSLNTAAYQSSSRSSSYSWSEQKQTETTPALQFTGVGADTLSLPGVIFPTFRGGLGQVEAMRREAEKGKPLMLIDLCGLIDANKNALGYWCITSIKEKRSDFLPAGIPQKIEFTLELKYYGEKI